MDKCNDNDLLPRRVLKQLSGTIRSYNHPAALIHCFGQLHFLSVHSSYQEVGSKLVNRAMASINDLATAAVSALAEATPPTAPPSSLPDSAQNQTDDRRPRELAVARGALVVLEGLDRSGKTTQVKLLEQRFVELGRKVKVMRFPGMYMTTPTNQ
jgi:hypothetical protein